MRCVYDPTPNYEPGIGELTHGIYAFVGGNGTAAKSSLEIGRLLAFKARTEEWPSDTPVKESDVPLFPSVKA
jgi:glycine/D-amino acid oxidase-like deaminating enzyme